MSDQKLRAPSIEEFKELLKKYSLKATSQRLSVHRAMLKLGHASADMVREEIRTSSQDKITVASVYNILSQLSLLGIYSHRFSPNNIMYFDVNTFKHMHLYDCQNNMFKDFVDDKLYDYVESEVLSHRFRGFQVEGIDVQIICKPTKRNKLYKTNAQ
jgi:Fe2+ or Zn2+ uptake regulation protein